MQFFEMRKAAGITQGKAAEALKVTQSALSQWENGVTCPDARRLCAVAALYGCTVDDLLKDNTKEA